MTKRDYLAISEIFATVNTQIGPHSTPKGTLNALAYDIALALSQDNPRFDRLRFLAACGLEG